MHVVCPGSLFHFGDRQNVVWQKSVEACRVSAFVCSRVGVCQLVVVIICQHTTFVVKAVQSEPKADCKHKARKATAHLPSMPQPQPHTTN